LQTSFCDKYESTEEFKTVTHHKACNIKYYMKKKKKKKREVILADNTHPKYKRNRYITMSDITKYLRKPNSVAFMHFMELRITLKQIGRLLFQKNRKI
jgi:hypothetical protein